MSESNIAEQFKFPVPSGMEPSEPIVVVEDQQDLRLIVAHHLNKIGYAKVSHAANGFEAMDVLAKIKQPAIILCDMDMPVMGGLDLLAELREKPDVPRGPFCLMMDDASKAKVMLAVETGVDVLIAKPLTLGDIVPKLKAAFKIFHNPKNPEKVYELAKNHLKEGRLVDAQKIYTLLATSAPKAARPAVGLARVSMKEGKMDQAIAHLKDAEVRNPNYVHTFAVRGEIFCKMSDWTQAIEAFSKAIEMSPLNPLRYNSAVEILFKVTRYQDAADLLATAEKNSLDFPGIHHFHSQALFMLKDFKGSIKYIKRSLADDPENVVYLNQLGICLKESGDFEEAQKTYNKVIKIDPENTSALYNKSIMLNAKGDHGEAVKLLERLLKKAPDFALARAKLEEYKKAAATAGKPAA